MASESQMNFANAIGYIDKVKARFEDRPERYQQFLQVFVEQTQQSPDSTKPPEEVVAGTRSQMEDIFKDDPDLLQEFEQFVPEELRRTDETVGGK